MALFMVTLLGLGVALPAGPAEAQNYPPENMIFGRYDIDMELDTPLGDCTATISGPKYVNVPRGEVRSWSQGSTSCTLSGGVALVDVRTRAEYRNSNFVQGRHFMDVTLWSFSQGVVECDPEPVYSRINRWWLNSNEWQNTTLVTHDLNLACGSINGSTIQMTMGETGLAWG